MQKKLVSRLQHITLLILLVIALGTGGFPFLSQPAIADDGENLIPAEIESPPKGNPKLDSRLNKMASESAEPVALSFAQQQAAPAEDNSIRLIIESVPGQAGEAVIAAGALGTVEAIHGDLIQVLVPVSQLTALADSPNIRFARLPMEPLPTVTSEGVALINADDLQAASYDGTGVKVAILDGGFTGYSALLGTELPASVTIQSFYAGSDIEGTTPHGTACAEIVYDIAPDAQFYLVNFGTSVELGNAVDWLIV